MCASFVLIDSFGCKYRPIDTGITYNNQMADFSIPRGLPRPSENNVIEPTIRKKPQSSMTPVIFTGEDGRVRLVASASDGPRITAAVPLVSNACLHSAAPELSLSPLGLRLLCRAG